MIVALAIPILARENFAHRNNLKTSDYDFGVFLHQNRLPLQKCTKIFTPKSGLVSSNQFVLHLFGLMCRPGPGRGIMLLKCGPYYNPSAGWCYDAKLAARDRFGT